jgi:hypothetical protein
MYCQCQTAVKGNGKEFIAVTLKCRAWTCPDCAPGRRNQLIAYAIDGRPNKFLTLTSKRQDGLSPITAARDLARAWRLVRLRLLRHYKLDALPFVAVFEKTKLGWPHLHILLRSRFLDQRLISTWMQELTGAPIVHIEALDDPKKAVRYCAKYISKDSEKFGTCKRYWSSRDYRIVPERHKTPRALPSGDWYVQKFRLDEWCRTMTKEGFIVERHSPTMAYASLAPSDIRQRGGP